VAVLDAVHANSTVRGLLVAPAPEAGEGGVLGTDEQGGEHSAAGSPGVRIGTNGAVVKRIYPCGEGDSLEAFVQEQTQRTQEGCQLRARVTRMLQVVEGLVAMAEDACDA